MKYYFFLNPISLETSSIGNDMPGIVGVLFFSLSVVCFARRVVQILMAIVVIEIHCLTTTLGFLKERENWNFNEVCPSQKRT